MADKKEYLGDGAYAELDGWGVKLTAENGILTLSRGIILFAPYL